MLPWYRGLCLLCTVALVTEGLVRSMQSLPADLQGYLNTCRGMGDLRDYEGELIFWTSMQQYITKFIKSRPDMTSREATFFRSNVNNIMAPLYGNLNTNGRKKRQAQAGGPPRIRREIRTLSPGQRQQFFRAVNALKNDRRLSPNVYDVLQSFHTGANIGRAHFGPAFPAWHRIYLWLYEGFLRLHQPSVSVPFWASVLDDEMEDPRDSVIWSDGFFGNGVGEPSSGPFADWGTINPDTVFTRNIGNGGLYTYEGVAAIIRKTNNSQILIPTAEPDSNFEFQHGAPHVFVGGTMNRLDAAARDPIFFCHHAFVDQIWEEFRFNQIDNGINPELDYPWIEGDPRFRPEHNRTAMMGFFPNNELNIDYPNWVGYSNVFFRLVRYEEVPSCPRCGGSPYLFCNTTLTPPRCVSRTTGELRGAMYVDDIMSVDFSQPGAQSTSVTTTTSRIDSCPRRPLISDVRTVLPPPMSFPRQPSRERLVFIPIKIVSKRPPSLKGYQEFSLYNENIRSMHNVGPKAEFLQKGFQKGYRQCEKSSQNAAGKIKVVAYGLNYDGESTEYAVVDNRYGLSQTNVYLPVKSPNEGQTEAIVAAFDSCGRVCKPYCMDSTSGSGSTSGLGSNRRVFSGGIRVTTDLPLQYGRSYAEATIRSWVNPSPNSCPTLDESYVPLSFFCDYTDDWIWPSGESGTTGRTVNPRMRARPSVSRGSTRPRPSGSLRGMRPRGPAQRGRGQRGRPSRVSHQIAAPSIYRRRGQQVPGRRQTECEVDPTCTIPFPCEGCARGQLYHCDNSNKMAICVRRQYIITKRWTKK